MKAEVKCKPTSLSCGGQHEQWDAHKATLLGSPLEHQAQNASLKLRFITQYIMICDTCFKMLRGQDGRIWKGTYDLNFKHHTRMKNLRRSADMHCGICRVLFVELQAKSGVEYREPSVSMHFWSTHSSVASLQSKLQTLRTHWIFAHILQFLCAINVFKLLQGLYKPSYHQAEAGRKVPKTIAAASVTNVDELPLSITASLRVGQQRALNGSRVPGELYYLTFKLRYGHIRCRRVFALQRTGTEPGGQDSVPFFANQ